MPGAFFISKQEDPEPELEPEIIATNFCYLQSNQAKKIYGKVIPSKGNDFLNRNVYEGLLINATAISRADIVTQYRGIEIAHGALL